MRGLPYLCEFRATSRESRLPSLGRRAQLQSPEGQSAPFYLADLASRENQTTNWQLPSLAEPESNHDAGRRLRHTYFSWVWPPCESLLFGTAYEGIKVAERNRRERTPEPFAGSLHHGVDAKATLRAIIRGEQRVQVKVDVASMLGAASGEGDDEPTVFLFERESSVTDGRWEPFLACLGSDVRRLARDTARCERVIRQHGDAFIANVSFCTNRELPASLKGHATSLCHLYGIVVFGNPCLNPRQAVRWLEATDYTRCPILRHSGSANLFDYYKHKHNMVLDRNRWTSSLARIALPYAKQRVTIIAPEAHVIPSLVFREASARKIKLEIVSLSHFPKQRIDAIRNQYLVSPTDVDAMSYSDELQAAFGESPDAHVDLLPAHIRAQLDLES